MVLGLDLSLLGSQKSCGRGSGGEEVGRRSIDADKPVSIVVARRRLPFGLDNGQFMCLQPHGTEKPSLSHGGPLSPTFLLGCGQSLIKHTIVSH